jgi:ketosteroid isomerase-like protein
MKLPGAAVYGGRELFADDVVWEAPSTPPTGGVIRDRGEILEQ